MTRIERGLSRLAKLAGQQMTSRLTLGSRRQRMTDVAVTQRLEQTLQKIELYIQCRREPPTLERALRRAVALVGGQ